MSDLILKPAPRFYGTAVQCDTFKSISLSNFAGRYLVLFFYPLDFTTACSSDVVSLSKVSNDLLKLQCDVVGISCDSHFSHLAWTKSLMADGQHLSFPLLSDKATRISRDYGVYNEDKGTPYQAVFILDKKQIVRQILIEDDLITCSAEEILQRVSAIKNSDEQENNNGPQKDDARGTKRPIEEDNALHLPIKHGRKIEYNNPI